MPQVRREHPSPSELSVPPTVFTASARLPMCEEASPTRAMAALGATHRPSSYTSGWRPWLSVAE